MSEELRTKFKASFNNNNIKKKLGGSPKVKKFQKYVFILVSVLIGHKIFDRIAKHCSNKIGAQ